MSERVTISLLHRHQVGGGAALDDGVAHQVAALDDHSRQLRHIWTNRKQTLYHAVMRNYVFCCPVFVFVCHFIKTCLLVIGA